MTTETAQSPNKRGHRFGKGNKFGRGNPLGRQVNQLRVALAKAVTPADIQKITKALVRKAKKGDVAAAKEVYDRLLGKANQPVSLTGDAAKAARALTAAFNHVRYTELFRRSVGDGCRASAAVDN